ncbi:MAG: zinc ABC transporter substrate-binding protein [Armatimonadota bacterium]|nr:zinc ABC transporter substrate-binding protein [Armatimonadota bacterium]MDR7444471.1 zinc ABC transporter substrate-binding protein [Armatimonadota bacterium]MDR7570173.1 zinc ABC transporter substrate-binding protein [Armatimonadota bacterium]MDR7615224.1 zinc ABC transporter substrate-binding protein [Armatimonadota bacterium]
MRRILLLALPLLLLGAVEAAGPQRPLAVATFYPLYEFTRRVAAGRFGVRQLVPAGMEVHHYEPTPRDLLLLRRTRVLFYNGAGLEPWVEKLRPELPKDVLLVNTTEGLPLLRPRPGAAVDPHVWLDPVLAQEQVERIRAGLSRADPEGSEVYRRNARRIRAELAALHERFRERLRRCRTRTFITAHAAFGYLARRYGLEMIPITGLAPEAEPSPAKIREVVRLARRYGVRVVYFESPPTRRIAEAIAREVGAHTAVLHPLETLHPEEQNRGRTYFTVMAENLRQLAHGLECR